MLSALSIDHVSKTYPGRAGQKVVAVSDASFEAQQGEFFALLGPSGCGKSTLLSMIAGLDTPDTGTVRLGDQEVTAPSDDVALMFQDPVLLPWKTSMDNVLLPRLARSWSRPSRHEKAAAQEALDSVGLGDFVHSYPWELSGGMQRRVSLARIIYQNTGVLLMDEPFSSLDEFTRFGLNVLLRRLVKAAGQTVVLVTHNVEEAVLLANRIGIMSPRPGHLEQVIHVDLPGKRDEETMTSDAFGEAVRTVRQVMNQIHSAPDISGGAAAHRGGSVLSRLRDNQ